MEAFKIFTSKKEDSDSDDENKESIFKTKGITTPYRNGQIRSRDLNLSVPRQSKGPYGNQKSEIKIPVVPSSSKIRKFNMNNFKPANTLDDELSRKKNELLKSTKNTYEKKAGNENQENNDNNQWEDELEQDIDVKKTIADNKILLENTRTSMAAAQNELQSR